MFRLKWAGKRAEAQLPRLEAELKRVTLLTLERERAALTKGLSEPREPSPLDHDALVRLRLTPAANRFTLDEMRTALAQVELPPSTDNRAYDAHLLATRAFTRLMLTS
jgi:hypothetical protein